MGLTLLLERELRRLDRRGLRRRVVRVATVVMLAVVLFAAHREGPGAPFLALMMALLQVTLFLQPVRTAGMLAQARADGTLPLLGLTPLRPWAILGGTCVAALVLAGEGLLLALPLASVAAAYGGLDPLELLRACAGIVVAATLGTAIGAWVGAQGDRVGGGAATRALGWMLLVFFSPTLGTGACQALGATGAAAVFESMLLFNAILPTSAALPALAANLLLAALFFGLGVRRLGRTTLGGDARPRARKSMARARARGVPLRRIVAWRERHRLDPRQWIRPGFLGITAVVLLFGAGIAAAARTSVDAALMLLLLMDTMLWLLALAWGLLTGARSYAEDREDGTLELLLVTRLTPTRIVLEKLLGALRRGQLALGLGALLHGGSVVLAVLHGGGAVASLRSALGAAAAVLLWAAGPALAVGVGQLFSILAPSSDRAQAWAAVAAGATFFGGSFLLCGVQASISFAASAGAGGVGEVVVYGVLSGASGLGLVIVFFVLRSLLARIGERA